MNSNEQNISRVANLYEKLFLLRQDSHFLFDYYFELKETLDELDFYAPLVLDLKVLQWYQNKLTVAKFLSELDTSLGNQVREQIIGSG